MLWPRAVGLDCCYAGVAFLKVAGGAEGVVDPFVGQGTVVAMANALGLHGIGVELSPKRCRKANNLNIDLELISPLMRTVSLAALANRDPDSYVRKQQNQRSAGECKPVQNNSSEENIEG
jgi:tRNA G10  N-methylase Trm11